MPQVGPMLPPLRLCKENTDGDGLEFIKPTSENAAMRLRCPTVQIRSAYSAIVLTELEMHFGVRAA